MNRCFAGNGVGGRQYSKGRSTGSGIFNDEGMGFFGFYTGPLVFAANMSNMVWYLLRSIHSLPLYSMRRHMKRTALYSTSRRSFLSRGISLSGSPERNDRSSETATVPSTPLLSFRHFIERRERISWLLVGGLLALLLIWGYGSMAPSPLRITQKDIDRAVRHTLETQTLPSPAA